MKARTADKKNNLFHDTIQANANWLLAILPEIGQLSMKDEKKATDFIDNLNKIISTQEFQEEYEKKPDQAIYLTWINMLDPKIDPQTKEKLCAELAQHYTQDKKENLIGGKLSYMPSILTAPILLYSPIKILSSYYEYQKKYAKYSAELCDNNFENTLKAVINNKLFSNQAKTNFLKRLVEMLKLNSQQSFFASDNPDYLLHQAIASWERNSLTADVSKFFDHELKTESDKFQKKLQETLENPNKNLNLRSEFGSLAFEKLVTKYKSDLEKLTPIVIRLHDENDLRKLAEIYTSHDLNAVSMFKQHLVQIAKSTNEPNHYSYSSLFFSGYLSYLKKADVKSIAPEIASLLSPSYYANEAYAFSSIRKEMFTFWINHQPEKIVAIVNAVLKSPKEYHETPIEKFFFSMHFDEMPDSFYDKLAILFSDKLKPNEFIQVYTTARSELQTKLLAALISDEHKALIKLKDLNDAYQKGNFSTLFPRIISSQLKAINPTLQKQAEEAKLFVTEEIKDDLETDLRLLRGILENESLTHDERRSEMHRLKNLHAALNDKKIDTCPVVIKMFKSVPQNRWPDLFAYFDAEIIHWSFPQDEEHLKLFYPDISKRPAPRKNTWLEFRTQWEEVLYGSLVAIIADISKEGLRRDVAHWALSDLDQAFSKSSAYFPGLADKVLKKFFLENAPNSIKIFIALQNKFNNKYHASTYFSKERIYEQVASWLPEDAASRAMILSKLLQVDSGFEPALHRPFVRGEEDVALTALTCINTRTAHIVNLFEKLPSDSTRIIFKILNQVNEKDFLTLLQDVFLAIGNAQLPASNYMRFVVMLLSFSEQANIDIFKIIDADPNKSLLLNTFSNMATWESSSTLSIPYKLIYKIMDHYLPEQLQKIVFEHIQPIIKKDDTYSLSECINAAKEITNNKFVLPKHEEKMLIDYLTKNISRALDYPHALIELMDGLIPNVDKLLLELISKKSVVQDKLSSNDKKCLDNLVKVYGFSHINAMCLKLNLTDCSAYLVKKFSKFPDILQQMDEAIKKYNRIFDEYPYKLNNDMSVWSFNEKLRSAILEAAKESNAKSIEINVAEVCAKSGIAPDLVAMMPSLTIKSASAENVSSLITDSWKKSGLITASPLPTDTSSVADPQKTRRLSN